MLAFVSPHKSASSGPVYEVWLGKGGGDLEKLFNCQRGDLCDFDNTVLGAPFPLPHLKGAGLSSQRQG